MRKSQPADWRDDEITELKAIAGACLFEIL
jgi:hypothetical protein